MTGGAGDGVVQLSGSTEHASGRLGLGSDLTGTSPVASFPIFKVQSEWVLDDEAMGTKAKFWYRKPGVEVEWLFKYPQENTGQHWAEKIAAEVADLLRVPHARVELAEFEGERGSVTESFAREGRELRHGNEVLAKTVSYYDPGQRFRQSEHSLDNIWSALGRVFLRPESARRAKLRFAEYLMLDALIGNTDRHHENWGLLVRRVGDKFRGFLAPSFDHASSLGRELLDERRAELLAGGSRRTLLGTWTRRCLLG